MTEVNPKDAAGEYKWRQFHCIPPAVLMHLGVGMRVGGDKYGPYNFRETPIQASSYIDATLGHIYAWVEGEDIDPDSPGLSHIIQATNSLIVLLDAIIQETLIDDRPPASDVDRIRDGLQEVMDSIHAADRLRTETA